MATKNRGDPSRAESPCDGISYLVSAKNATIAEETQLLLDLQRFRSETISVLLQRVVILNKLNKFLLFSGRYLFFFRKLSHFFLPVGETGDH